MGPNEKLSPLALQKISHFDWIRDAFTETTVNIGNRNNKTESHTTKRILPFDIPFLIPYQMVSTKFDGVLA